jgi:hypothetical protein
MKCREGEPCIFQYQLTAMPLGPITVNISHDTLDDVMLIYHSQMLGCMHNIAASLMALLALMLNHVTI